MSDELNQNLLENDRRLWEEWVPIHVKSEFYGVDNFVAGENSLNTLELGEVGDVEGKNLLHLQCHFGMDTLNWARLGAHVTGMDFSESAIEQANELAARCNLDARFLCCNLYDLPQNLLGQYDIVYTSYSVLAWLPDIPRWAKILASYVKPEGFFYIAEFHRSLKPIQIYTWQTEVQFLLHRDQPDLLQVLRPLYRRYFPRNSR